MYLRSEKNNHDRGRSTLRERARKHFLKEKKEMEHELSQNRTLIERLMNDGYCFETTTRNENRYDVHFTHPKTSERRDCVFNFESNYTILEPLWLRRDRT